jgi:hypothetical protein
MRKRNDDEDQRKAYGKTEGMQQFVALCVRVIEMLKDKTEQTHQIDILIKNLEAWWGDELSCR